MKRAVIYICVSTQEQTQEGYSIGEQRERLIAYCKAYDWVIADIYVDGGYSGGNLKRTAIQKLMTETAKFDVVLVYKPDRLSRSQRDTFYLIEEIFLPNTVNFVSLQESFDTASPFGKAMIGLLAVFAQLDYEAEQVRKIFNWYLDGMSLMCITELLHKKAIQIDTAVGVHGRPSEIL